METTTSTSDQEEMTKMRAFETENTGNEINEPAGLVPKQPANSSEVEYSKNCQDKANKNEILLASVRLNLKILAAVMVIPALLTPGINASI